MIGTLEFVAYLYSQFYWESIVVDTIKIEFKLQTSTHTNSYNIGIKYVHLQQKKIVLLEYFLQM